MYRVLYVCLIKKKSGGIIIIYKEELKSMLQFYNTPSDFVQWLKLSKKLINQAYDVILGCIYIPPENSKYSSVDCFQDIENEMNDNFEMNNQFVLVGDFNAKTKNLDDFVQPDDTLIEALDINSNDDLFKYFYDVQKLDNLHIPLKRVSQCKARPNSFGYKMLDFCKENNVYIANGRIGKDKSVGKKNMQ